MGSPSCLPQASVSPECRTPSANNSSACSRFSRRNSSTTNLLLQREIGQLALSASRYGRYGYRRVRLLLTEAGWQVGCDRVQRIWRREGLKVPKRQKPRGRLWLNDGSCIRLRPQHRNHVWSYDFVEAQTHDGRKLRLMTLIDEFTRECLAIRVARRINSFGVIETMADAMLERGVPEHIRSDNGAEMTAKIVRSWLAKLGTKTLYIEPGSPWENGYCELFNGKLRDECLNGEIFYSLKEAIVVLEQWRNQYNTIRPHSSLNYWPPAPQTSTAHHFTWIAVTRCIVSIPLVQNIRQVTNNGGFP